MFAKQSNHVCRIENATNLLQAHARQNIVLAKMHCCQNDTRQIFKLKSYRASKIAESDECNEAFGIVLKPVNATNCT